MKCLVCGSEFKPTGHGKAPKYCSNACRQKAYKARHKANATVKPARHVSKRDCEREPVNDGNLAPLSRLEFHRMMDDSMEDVLRLNRDVLSRALTSPDTPANALAAISRQLLAVTERLDRLEGGDPLLDAIDGDAQDLTQEADDDAGKAIV